MTAISDAHSAAARENGKKGGRPPKVIDADQVRLLATYGCSNVEIGRFFKMDEGTIRKRFAAELEEGRGELEAALRQKQVRKALDGKGDTTMLIWLGKNYLNQSDKQQVSGPNGGPQQHQFIDPSEKAKRLERVRRVLAASAGKHAPSTDNSGVTGA